MPLIDLGKQLVSGADRARRLAIEVARQTAISAVKREVAPYASELQKIKPIDIVVFIKKGQDLMPFITEVARLANPDATGDEIQALIADYPIGKLAKLSTNMVIEVLRDIHPGLAAVLDTPAGRAWWEQQRRTFR